MLEQPSPIPLRYLDLTLPSGALVQLTLYPADTVTTAVGPSRLIVEFREKRTETFTLFLGPGVIVQESAGLQYPIPVDETGQPRRFASVEEYQTYLATREA